MTIEEMLETAQWNKAALDFNRDAHRWQQVAALCERLDTQNALLERIAAAMEARAVIAIQPGEAPPLAQTWIGTSPYQHAPSCQCPDCMSSTGGRRP